MASGAVIAKVILAFATSKKEDGSNNNTLLYVIGIPIALLLACICGIGVFSSSQQTSFLSAEYILNYAEENDVYGRMQINTLQAIFNNEYGSGEQTQTVLKEFLDKFKMSRSEDIKMADGSTEIKYYSVFAEADELKAVLTDIFKYTSEDVEKYIKMSEAPQEKLYTMNLQNSSSEASSSTTSSAILESSKNELSLLPGYYFPPTHGEITDHFGERENPTGDGTDFHNGLDLSKSPHQPITAVADGEVYIVSENTPSDLGNYIFLKHTDKLTGTLFYTVYGHLSQLKVKEGDLVLAGDIIAFSGGGAFDVNPGRSTGQHLHFEFRYKQIANRVNPEDYILIISNLPEDLKAVSVSSGTTSTSSS